MSFTTSSLSRHVITAFIEQPKSIVIVLGHLGADDRELKRLSKPYLDRNCAIVAARSPPLDFLLTQHGRLRPVAEAIFHEVGSLIQYSHRDDAQQTPITIHMWSNGGTFLWEEMMKDNRMDSKLGSMLKCIAYDSCPCYLHLPWALVPYWHDAFPFPGWASWQRKMYLVAASLGISFWCLLTCSIRRSACFWQSMENSPCHNLLFLYSTNDKVTDASRIDALVAEQRLQGKNITVFRYDDSAHCKLDKDHPQDYDRAIDLIMELSTVKIDTK